MIFAVPLGELGRSRSLAWMPVSTGPTTGPVGSINAHPVSDTSAHGMYRIDIQVRAAEDARRKMFDNNPSVQKVCDVAKPGPVQCIPTGDDCQCTTGTHSKLNVCDLRELCEDEDRLWILVLGAGACDLQELSSEWCAIVAGHWFRQSDGAFYDGSKFQPVP